MSEELKEQSVDRDVFELFRKRKLRQLIAAIPTVLAVVPLVMAEDAGPEGLAGIPITVLAPVCLAVIVGAVIFSLLNWRCPGCKGYLGKKLSPRFCSKCGIQLQA